MKREGALDKMRGLLNEQVKLVHWEFDPSIGFDEEFNAPEPASIHSVYTEALMPVLLYSWKDAIDRIKHRLIDVRTGEILCDDLPQVPDFERWTMPVGKHKGKTLSEIPEDYLQWASQNMSGNIKKRVQQFLKG